MSYCGSLCLEVGLLGCDFLPCEAGNSIKLGRKPQEQRHLIGKLDGRQPPIFCFRPLRKRLTEVALTGFLSLCHVAALRLSLRKASGFPCRTSASLGYALTAEPQGWCD